MTEIRIPNLIGPLNFFQAHEDCDQRRIANGTSLSLRHHKGHKSNNKDSCGKSKSYRGSHCLLGAEKIIYKDVE